MSTGEELLEQRRQRRRARDCRLSPGGREPFVRMANGDRVEEFQAALDGDLEADSLLGECGDTDEVA